MEPAFWRAKWESGQIGFHSDQVHPDLVETEQTFLGDTPKRVFVPLCGKSVDLDWLAARRHGVVGVELVQCAVEAVFERMQRTPEWQPVPGGKKAEHANLAVYQGDFFELDPEAIGTVDRVWDRAALIALHPDKRAAYVQRVRELLRPGGQILLNVLSYDPSVMDGPPWSVDADTVRALYPEAIELGRRSALDDRWRERGHTQLDAVTWLITPT